MNATGTPPPPRADSPKIYDFCPDWTVPPAEMLKEWAEEQGLNDTGLRALLAAYEHDLGEILDNPPAPLTPQKAEQLDTATGIPARLWTRFEELYRADLTRLVTIAEIRKRLDPSMPPGALLKYWASENDPHYTALHAAFDGDTDTINAILTGQHKLTPDDVFTLRNLTDIAPAVWSEQEYDYRNYLAANEQQ